MPSLASLVPPAWRAPLADALAAPTFTELERFLETERDVLPPRAQVFRALELTPPSKVRVVLLGQDPYPTPGNANGLAFSVSPGVKAPPSLKNLFAGLAADVGTPIPSHGDLTAWAERGVLLINTVLSVRAGEPNSHQRRGWEPFTRAVLAHLARRPERTIFLCLGKPAQKLVGTLETTQPVISAPHPSPLNGNAFVDTAKKERPFTRIAELLGAPLDWALPSP